MLWATIVFLVENPSIIAAITMIPVAKQAVDCSIWMYNITGSIVNAVYPFEEPRPHAHCIGIREEKYSVRRPLPYCREIRQGFELRSTPTRSQEEWEIVE